jgi:hypothetical protein
MPERRFDTGYWNDPDIVDFPMKAKLFYLYLWTNRHCNQAGLYEISLKTISFETDLAIAEIPDLLKILEKKVTWLPDENLVWVKNFLRHQAKSPKFLAAALDNIESLNNAIPEEMKEEFYSYNERLLAAANIEHEPSLSKRECVIIRDNFQCQYCGKPLIENSDYEMDHIIPRVRGGKEHYLNLAASCRACNARKLTQTPEEAGLPHPNVTSFHAAQAIFFLKNDSSIRERWLKMFPDKACNVESMLHNIDSTSLLSYSHSLSGSGKEDDKGGVGEKKGKNKNKVKKPTVKPKKGDSTVNEIFEEMRSYLGFPDKITQDPIPSYGKEGQAIKRMLTRGFTREAIVECWKSKVSQRGGEFISMIWVNEDIGKSETPARKPKQLSSEAEIAASIKEAKS